MKRTIFLTAILLGAAGCASRADSSAVDETPASKSVSTSALAPTAASTPAATPTPRTGSATHAAAATASLKTLAHLVSPQKTLGFQSASEVASASLANPLRMVMVGLDPLKAYRAGDDARPLLLDEGTVIYPVTVGGDARSSVVVRQENGVWKTTQFGRPVLAKLAHEGRARVTAARGVAESDVALVEIPTLSTRMLEHEEKGVPMLTALLDVPGTDLRAGTTLPAADVFAKLQPLAALNDGSSPN